MKSNMIYANVTCLNATALKFQPLACCFTPFSADNTVVPDKAHGVAPGEAFCRPPMIPIEAGGGRAEGR